MINSNPVPSTTPTPTPTNMVSIKVTVKGLVETNLSYTETISNQNLTITQTGTADVIRNIQLENGKNFNITLTRPNTHISCLATPLTGTVSATTEIIIQCNHICTLNYSEIAKIEYSIPFQEELQKQAAKGSSGPETIQIIADRSVTTEMAYGSVLAPNGNIYTTPFTSLAITRTNTTNNSFTTLGTSVSSFRHGGVLAPSGLIYMMNQAGANAQIFDPTSETITLSFAMPSSLTSVSGIYSPNTDRIYVPQLGTTSTNVFSINTNTNTSSTLTGTKNQQYYGCALAHKTGMIYCAALSTCNPTCSILKINPITNSISELSYNHTTGAFIGIVYAPNDKMYLIPFDSDSVTILDPNNDAIDDTTITGLGLGGFKWAGGVLAPNGKIYGTPESSNQVLMIDTNTNTTNTTTLINLNNSSLANITAQKFAGAGKIATNGLIYLSPRFSQRVLAIDTKSNGSYCQSIRLSPNFNKF